MNYKRLNEILDQIDKIPNENDRINFVKSLNKEDQTAFKVYKTLLKERYPTLKGEYDKLTEEQRFNFIKNLPPESKQMFAAELEREKKKHANDQEFGFPDKRSADLSVLDRAVIKNTVPQSMWAQAIKKKYPDHEVIAKDGNIWMKRPEEKEWANIDPNQLEWEDVTDIATDIVTGPIEALGAGTAGAGSAIIGTGIGGPFLGIPAGIAGTAAGGGGTAASISAAKQYLAQKLGYIDEINKDVIESDAQWGAGLSMIPGGKTVPKGAKEALAAMKMTGYVPSGKGYIKTKVPRGMEYAENTLYPLQKGAGKVYDQFRAMASGNNTRDLELLKKHITHIDKAAKAQSKGHDTLLPLVREFRGDLTKGFDNIGKEIDLRKRMSLEQADKEGLKVNGSALRKAIYAEEKKMTKDLPIVQSKLKKLLSEDELNAYVMAKGMNNEIGSEIASKIEQKYAKKGIKEAPAGSDQDRLDMLKRIRKQIPKGEMTNVKANEVKQKLTEVLNEGFDYKATPGKKDAAHTAKPFVEQLKDSIEANSPGYRDANASYALMIDAEQELAKQGLLEGSIDRLKKKYRTDPAAREQQMFDTYGGEEGKAREVLTKYDPALKANLQMYDKDMPGGDLYDAYEKAQAVRQWSDKSINSPVRGAGKTGFLTNSIFSLGVGGLGGELFANSPAIGAAVGGGLRLGMLYANSPKGLIKQAKAGKAIDDLVQSRAGRYTLGLQPVRGYQEYTEGE